MFSYSIQEKYMNVKSIGYEKVQYEIEQNATSYLFLYCVIVLWQMIEDKHYTK